MEEVWKASDSDFIRNNIDQKIINSVKEARRHDPDKELKRMQSLNIDAVTIKDKNYPKLLHEISDPPALLYIKGEFIPEDDLSIAVVGARKFTSYGERTVEHIVDPLAKNKMTIVSGLALGIDSLSHKAALRANGRTIAVLGNGLDRIYPESNKHLAHEIVSRGGAIISEFPLGTPSYKQNFPFRNRIIAGLGLGTLVIEAALESGSLITARAALDYNRQVFAVPGDIFNPTSEGPNNLIKMGAQAVISSEDILSALNIDKLAKHHKAKKILPDTKEEAVILEYLGYKPIHIDKLAESSKLDIVKINQTLTMMEMKGKIRNLGGNQYIINA
jgi:DNA processing protein